MRIGILQTDSVLAQFQPDHGDYPRMFMDLFDAAGQDMGLAYQIIDAQASDYPPADRCHSYVITGSRHSVYDDLPWIAELAAFAESALDAGRPVVGICFGHQLMAHFFGGRAAKASGWAVGVHASELLVDEPWLSPHADGFNLLSSHKDQVTELPPGARLIATNDFCPLAGFTHGDLVLTFQGHPEFRKGYSKDLMNMRRDLLGEETWRAGIASLDMETHQGLVGRWILNFCAAKAGASPD